MTEMQWNYVMTTNSLLHGLAFNKTSFTLQVAREPSTCFLPTGLRQKRHLTLPFSVAFTLKESLGADSDSKSSDFNSKATDGQVNLLSVR